MGERRSSERKKGGKEVAKRKKKVKREKEEVEACKGNKNIQTRSQGRQE